MITSHGRECLLGADRAVQPRGRHQTGGKFPLIGGRFDGEEWDFEDETEIARRFPRVAHYLGFS
ncbi:hypothetical protein [Streptosporangium sp. CA-115845]|uniref:hypothetical protein n=1 Tax=Streptosporangium sp. CA-115845 TaxID=3240071 RepID=UPI003D928850